MEYVLQQDLKPYQVSKFLQELAWRDYFQRIYQSLGDNLLANTVFKQKEVKHRELQDPFIKPLPALQLLMNG